jgi:tRNA(Ile)-lysidine synthetase-like protein
MSARAVERVRAEVARRLAEDRLPPAATLLVAVSGGQDSVCLLDALASLPGPGAPRLVVFHLDHRLRGDRSSADAAAVERLAAGYGLEICLWRIDVRAYAQAHRLGLEAAGRFARYQALRAEAARRAAFGAATAHTADDRVESVLMHLLRGSGLAGLAGIAPGQRYTDPLLGPPLAALGPVRSAATPALQVIRPLLAVSRRDSGSYCRARNLPVRVDETNFDPTYLRNRVRHQLVPLLLSYNRSLRASLTQLATIASDDEVELERLTDAAWRRIARLGEAEVAFGWSDWRPLSPALQRRLLRRAGQQLSGQAGWSFRSVESGRRLLEHRLPGRQVSLGGGVVLRSSRQGFALRAAHPTRTAAASGGQAEAAACSTTSNQS